MKPKFLHESKSCTWKWGESTISMLYSSLINGLILIKKWLASTNNRDGNKRPTRGYSVWPNHNGQILPGPINNRVRYGFFLKKNQNGSGFYAYLAQTQRNYRVLWWITSFVHHSTKKNFHLFKIAESVINFYLKFFSN